MEMVTPPKQNSACMAETAETPVQSPPCVKKSQLANDYGSCCIDHHIMTRYTNSGRKRTYLQASFDPNDHESLTTAAAQDSSDAQQEATAGALPEPSRKRQRTGEEKLTAESSTAAAKNDGNDKPVVKSEKTKKALAKLKAKEKAKRAKSTLSYLMKKG